MSVLLYYHQISQIVYLNNVYTYFGISTCQIWLQVIEGSLIQLRFFEIFHIFYLYNMSKFETL